MLPLIASEKYEELIEVANQTLELEPHHYLASLRLALRFDRLSGSKNRPRSRRECWKGYLPISTRSPLMR